MHGPSTTNTKTPEATPPQWARRLLAWYCRADLLEDLEGDLHEYFDRNLLRKGPRHARFIYCLDVLKFFRPYTIRKPSFLNLLIHWIMIGSYLKTSRRSLVRNKLFSLINIVGLAISMSVGLLVIAFVVDLVSYDEFHVKKDRIYRVISSFKGAQQPEVELASTSVKVGQRIRKQIPGIEALTILRNGFGADATYGETTLPIRGLWADSSFFGVFTFPMLEGNPATALKNPYSLVVTQQLADKLVGHVDPLGKTVRIDSMDYTITGLLSDVPKLSHLQFDALVSFTTAEARLGKQDPHFYEWKNIWNNYVYLVLPARTSPETVLTALNRFNKEENVDQAGGNTYTVALQPLKEASLGRRLHNAIGPTMIPLVVWVLGGLAFIVILSACFNYTNLSIARALRRSREVGIRKIVGAVRGHVLGQFLAESVLIALLSLSVSFGLFVWLRKEFLALDPFVSNLVSLELSPALIGYFFLMTIGVGLLAGFLPALFFSRIRPAQVLKDVSSLTVFRRVTLRKSLIVLQYTISLIFITTTLVGYRQYRSFITLDLGFSTENILNIDLQGNKSEVLSQEIAQVPGVVAISKSMLVTSLGSMGGSSMKYKRLDDSALVWLNRVDAQYLPIHKHKLLAGTNFTMRPQHNNESEVIVNEQLLKRFNIGGRKPEKAIGEQVLVDNMRLTIVGVLKDFHYGTVENKIEPVALRYFTDEAGGNLNVKMATNDLQATRLAIEDVWRRHDKVHPIKANLYDDQLEEAYRQFSVILKVIGSFTVLAICIAFLGLLGMVIFTTETRLKEISIRKILGATDGRLVYLLSKGFLSLLLVAAWVAIPVTYLFFDKVVLTNFAYHKPIGLDELLAGLIGVLIPASLLIGFQTLRAARKNPATVLRSE